MSVGVMVAVAVLVLGTGIGLWRRRVDGRLRPVRSAASSAGGSRPAAPAGGSRASSSAAALSFGAASPLAGVGERLDPELLASLGVGPAPATLLQFSSAFCAPCRAVRRVSAEVAAMVPGVRHIEVDAESHLEAVRALGVWRTPTLFVLDAGGRVSQRASGVPAKPQLIAALGEVLPAEHRVCSGPARRDTADPDPR